MHLRINKKINIKRVDVSSLVALSFILFFAEPLIHLGYNYLFVSILGPGVTKTLSTFTVYLPLMLACIVAPRKYIKTDFLLLWILVCLAFLLSWLVHSEYDYWYFRSDYGVWDYVLSFTNAFYSYLFIRLINDPEKIKKYLKISGWLMLLWFAYQFMQYFIRGYWYGVQGMDGSAEMQNSVSIGYKTLFFALLFMYDALQKKQLTDIAASGIYPAVVLIAGSRGPLLFMGVFILLYGLLANKNTDNSRKQITKFILVFLIFVVLYFTYNYILIFLLSVFPSTGSISRILQTIQSGSFMADNGRFKIWEAAYQMILENPWGHGPMGSQPVIGKIIFAGYPHSVFLELLIDYGVILGGFFICVIVWGSTMLLSKKNMEWQGLFVFFFCTACQVLISMCYWSSAAFWCALGIAMNCFKSRKYRSRMNLQT